jgi:hypothetical protein
MVTVTKIGLGVSIGFELLLDVAGRVGVDVMIGVLLELCELELAVVGAGAAFSTVVVTSCVTVGPGLTTSIVLVGSTIVACAGCVAPPSTLMTEYFFCRCTSWRGGSNGRALAKIEMLASMAMWRALKSIVIFKEDWGDERESFV